MSRGLTLEQIEFLVGKGLTADEMLAFAKMGGSRSKGAERTARWRANKQAQSVIESVTSDVTGDVTRDVTSPPNEYISNPPPVSDETGLAAQPKSKRGTRLANDFDPPEDWIQWAMTKRNWSKAVAIEECECFARYWQAKPGREACKLDWPKTWQNWVANSRRQSEGKGATGPPGQDFYANYRREKEQQRRPAVG